MSQFFGEEHIVLSSSFSSKKGKNKSKFCFLIYFLFWFKLSDVAF